MLDDIPVLVFNHPKNQYSIEAEIKDMIENEAPFHIINIQLQKLKKYSYVSFIEKNLEMYSTNPKEYHKALQNLMQWNVDLNEPALKA